MDVFTIWCRLSLLCDCKCCGNTLDSNKAKLTPSFCGMVTNEYQMDLDYIIFQENGLFGAKNQTGEIVIAAQYKEMYDFSCGLSMVRNYNYQYAYINRDNNQVIPFGKYCWCDPQFVCGFARVMEYHYLEKKNLCGIIDALGNIIVPLKYDKIWTLNEKYLFSIKAFIGDREEKLNLHQLANKVILDGLTYINTYSVEAFKQMTNCEKIYVKALPNVNQLLFTYGCNIGFVAVTGVPKDPVIAIVANSSGKIFPLLMEKSDIGKTALPIVKVATNKKTTSRTYSHRTSFWDYEKENMNNVDNWSDPYGDEQAYYEGWSREDVESGLSDAYEGDLDARCNND